MKFFLLLIMYILLPCSLVWANAGGIDEHSKLLLPILWGLLGLLATATLYLLNERYCWVSSKAKNAISPAQCKAEFDRFITDRKTFRDSIMLDVNLLRKQLQDTLTSIDSTLGKLEEGNRVIALTVYELCRQQPKSPDERRGIDCDRLLRFITQNMEG